MTKKIVLDAGHGGSDPGAIGKKSKEKDIALKLVKETGKLLKSKGYDVVYTRETDVFVDLYKRSVIANNSNADIFLSLHLNSFSSKNVSGFETFRQSGDKGDKSKKLQNDIHDEIIKKIGISNRGKKSANFSVLRETNIPSVLIEYGFISNVSDENMMINNINLLAQLTVNGIVKYLDGVTVKPTSTPKPIKGYQGTSVVDYLKYKEIDSSFDNRALLAKKYGINGYVGTQSQNDRLLKALRGGKVSTPKPSNKPIFKVGSYVTLNKSASHFATGQTILSSVKGKRYKIIQVKSDRVLLSGIMSWVYKKDVS